MPKYAVELYVSGTVTAYVECESEEAARKRALELFDGDNVPLCYQCESIVGGDLLVGQEAFGTQEVDDAEWDSVSENYPWKEESNGRSSS